MRSVTIQMLSLDLLTNCKIVISLLKWLTKTTRGRCQWLKGGVENGAVKDHPIIRSSVGALNFGGDVDGDVDEDEDEDEEFIDYSEMSEYHFTLAQMVAEMISPVSELRPFMSPDAPVLQPIAVVLPSLQPDSQVPPNNTSYPSSSKP
ncbi:hypothetical protein R1flu_023904 [Riccia fluitans]|uniref:Uncharacterized protein n=1 Tax=Riccia fluitans TaxID=41844 RepID=A0ABD1XTD3_9MARC